MFNHERVERIMAHSVSQFGYETIVEHALKLFEESGELAGAVVRHTEVRDDRSWLPEIEHEAGDVLLTLVKLCARAGLSIEEVAESVEKRFLEREWTIGHKRKKTKMSLDDLDKVATELEETRFASKSWLGMELRLLLQNEIDRMIDAEGLRSSGPLAVKLGIVEGVAAALLDTRLWNLETQLASYEKLSDDGGRHIDLAEAVSGLWLASRFTAQKEEFPDAAYWTVCVEGNLSVTMINNDYVAGPAEWTPEFYGIFAPQQDDFDTDRTNSAPVPDELPEVPSWVQYKHPIDDH